MPEDWPQTEVGYEMREVIEDAVFVYQMLQEALCGYSNEIPDEEVRGTIGGKTEYKIQTGWFTSSLGFVDAGLDIINDPNFSVEVKRDFGLIIAMLRESSKKRRTREDVKQMEAVVWKVIVKMEEVFGKEKLEQKLVAA